MMSDAQLGILVTVLGAGLASIGAVIRWSVGVLTKALDQNTSAMIANSASNATLATKIDSISHWIHTGTTPARGITRRKTESEE